MRELEKEIAAVSADVIVEEQFNADRNFLALDTTLSERKAKIPYPETTTDYHVGWDYDDSERIQYEKRVNKPYWDAVSEIEKYCKKGSLYCGHLYFDNNHYYIMDKSLLETKEIVVDGQKVYLINSDDKDQATYLKFWRYPNENNAVQYSRNITMNERKVEDVEIILDKNNSLFGNISDAYLRKALIKNKQKVGIQSIIQTIQKKQDEIRSLSKEKSFIVQGCAGSGKTMVLLHRLRYLLFNKELRNSEYIFLVPGNKFKSFIEESSSSFNIQKDNILTYKEYYQKCLNRKHEGVATDTDELVFSSKYLQKIYSKEFMQEAYRYLHRVLSEQTEIVIGFCEEQINKLFDDEKLKLENEVDKIKKDTLRTTNEIINEIKDFLKTKISDSYDNLNILIEEIKTNYLKRKNEYEFAINPNITISPNDERLTKNEQLLHLKQMINAENLALTKAPIFTKLSHKNKLNALQTQYNNVYEKNVAELVEIEKNKYKNKAKELKYVYPNVSIDEVYQILQKLEMVNFESKEKLKETGKQIDSIEENFEKIYKSEIDYLNKLISISGECIDYKDKDAEQLSPLYDIFKEIINIGIELIDMLGENINEEQKKDLKKHTKLFSDRTENELYAYLRTLLFNYCKKQIRQEFDIKICDIYKHYWYLLLYCNYLTRPMSDENSLGYIFIDEAQDLSLSEIELIKKISSISHNANINLFGDTNQTITTHGIKDWSQLNIVSEIHYLNENFRNTNQIVDYCNKNLKINMDKVGVEGDEVNEYSTLEEAIKNSKNITNDAIFIVKDNYSETDLRNLLLKSAISNYEVYTVKSVKGLEFKEVYVFDYNMTENERYVAYTRALLKLNIIKSLPQTADRTKTLIVQGDDDEEIGFEIEE